MDIDVVLPLELVARRRPSQVRRATSTGAYNNDIIGDI
jgi:hypothetical protein